MGSTGETVTNRRFALDFGGEFTSDSFAFIDDMQSLNEGDPATIRLAEIDRSGAQFFIHEERSADRETSHAAEEVGFIAIQNGLI